MFRAAAILLLLAATPVAARDACPEFFANNTEPKLTKPRLEEKTVPICFIEFGVLHSGLSRGPLWSAEHLTADALAAGQDVPRPQSNSFHEEDAIPEEDRATLDDYRRSGYDRGHMTPNSDLSTEVAKEESFSLANIVPQAPCNNEELWEGIESAVRTLVESEAREAYIVTGPAYIGKDLRSLHGRVLVPTHVWKAIYVPSMNEASAYLTPNNNSGHWDIVSINDLKNKIGIDVFPGLDDAIKNKLAALPAPETPKHQCRVRRH